MTTTPVLANDQLAKLRAHVKKSRESFGFPTPTSMADVLLKQYLACAGSLQPQPAGHTDVRAFANLDPQEKLNRLVAELRNADGAHNTVPTPWVEWLLSEFDQLVEAEFQAA